MAGWWGRFLVVAVRRPASVKLRSAASTSSAYSYSRCVVVWNKPVDREETSLKDCRAYHE